MLSLHSRFSIALQRGEREERGERGTTKGDPCLTVGEISLTFPLFPPSFCLSSHHHFPPPSQCVLGLPLLFLLLLLLLKRLRSAWTVAASMQNGLWQFLSHQHLRRRASRSVQRCDRRSHSRR